MKKILMFLLLAGPVGAQEIGHLQVEAVVEPVCLLNTSQSNIRFEDLVSQSLSKQTQRSSFQVLCNQNASYTMELAVEQGGIGYVVGQVSNQRLPIYFTQQGRTFGRVQYGEGVQNIATGRWQTVFFEAGLDLDFQPPPDEYSATITVNILF